MRDPDRNSRKDDDSALEEFSDMLIDMSKAVNPGNRNIALHFHNVAPSLEKITAYDYANFENDVAAGKIMDEEMFMYKAMALLQKTPDFDAYRTNLRDLVNYLQSPKSRPDDALMDAYRIFLQDMAKKIRLLSDPSVI